MPENKELATIAHHPGHHPGEAQRPLPVMAEIVSRIKAMTPDELRESLVAAGIVTEDGKLAEGYR